MRDKFGLYLGLAFLLTGTAVLLWSLRQSPKPQDIQTRTAPAASFTNDTLGVQIATMAGQMARVVKVVDGDTTEVQLGEGVQKLRYIGIDTPETVDPRRPVGCFGKEASEENKRLVLDKEVFLEKDVSETDKYGRLLRFVYLKQPDGSMLFVNDYLVRHGFARASTYPPDVKYSEQFRQAEVDARAGKRGLWSKC